MSNPGTTVTHITVADMNDPWIKFAKPYASYTDALSETSSCSVYFYDKGVLYKGIRTGAWQYKECTDVACNGGINWNTYYAITIERLREYLTERYNTLLNFEPTLNSHGLYEIQVHYDGRCR
jgi:hypothetical protein